MKTIARLFIFTMFFGVSFSYANDINSYPYRSLDDIKKDTTPADPGLNRTATKLTDPQLAAFPDAHIGFKWMVEDSPLNDFQTGAWRPQGITIIPPTPEGNTFVAVTWYGRDRGIFYEDYSNRGARISFVDIADWNSIKYRHVLLVDIFGNTFADIHAGGLVYHDGQLHVPDNRGVQKLIYVFSIDDIQEVPNDDRDQFFGYRYILRPVDSYPVPITASFLSYDPTMDGGKILTGRFCKGSSYPCSYEEQALLWYTIGDTNYEIPCYPFPEKMQGAASFTTFFQKVLLISTSYGASNFSKLYIIDGKYYGCTGEREPNTSTTRTITFPSGLEDLHYEESSGDIWMLNEFESKRYVWAVNRKHYLLACEGDFDTDDDVDGSDLAFYASETIDDLGGFSNHFGSNDCSH